MKIFKMSTTMLSRNQTTVVYSVSMPNEIKTSVCIQDATACETRKKSRIVFDSETKGWLMIDFLEYTRKAYTSIKIALFQTKNTHSRNKLRAYTDRR